MSCSQCNSCSKLRGLKQKCTSSAGTALDWVSLCCSWTAAEVGVTWRLFWAGRVRFFPPVSGALVLLWVVSFPSRELDFLHGSSSLQKKRSGNGWSSYRPGLKVAWCTSGCVPSCFSCVWLFATPGTVAHQALLSMEFSRREYWSGCHFLLQEIFLTRRLNPFLLCLPRWQAGSLPLMPPGKLCHIQMVMEQSPRFKGTEE